MTKDEIDYFNPCNRKEMLSVAEFYLDIGWSIREIAINFSESGMRVKDYARQTKSFF